MATTRLVTQNDVFVCEKPEAQACDSVASAIRVQVTVFPLESSVVWSGWVSEQNFGNSLG